MKIANLSVHTMRTRWRDVRGWLQRRRPDIVALQKIGSKKDFPTEALLDIGYESTFLGRRSAADLGVAILSHRNFPQPEVLVRQLPGAEREEARFQTANVGAMDLFGLCAVWAGLKAPASNRTASSIAESAPRPPPRRELQPVGQRTVRRLQREGPSRRTAQATLVLGERTGRTGRTAEPRFHRPLSRSASRPQAGARLHIRLPMEPRRHFAAPPCTREQELGRTSPQGIDRLRCTSKKGRRSAPRGI